MRTVIQIASQWYAGSSILNLLLNAQPGVRGIGEAFHVYKKMPGYCSCGEGVERCVFCAAAPTEGFYRWCFDYYGCVTLVDASKSWDMMAVARDGSFPVKAIVLSRRPQAWLFSYRGHHEDALSMKDRLKTYIDSYRWALDAIERENVPHLCIAHEEVVTDPDSALRRICAFAGIAYDPSSLERWWETDTHVIGGNHAVHRQLREDREEFFERDARYKGRRHALFLDESWKNDAAFRAECAAAIEALREEFDAVLPRIVQPGAAELIAEVRA